MATSGTGKTQVKKRGNPKLKELGKATRFKPNDPETGEQIDKRINRKGTLMPKDQRELNAVIDEVLAEIAEDSKGNKMQKLRVVLNRLVLSKSPAGQIHILDRRYGKVPQPIQGGGADGAFVIKIVREGDNDK